jgi:hypothetical protein
VSLRALGTIPLTESEFQRQVVQLAENNGWDWMHIGRVGKHAANGAKGTLGTGWPDLVLVRGHRLIFAELKAESAPLPSTEQRKVLQVLWGLMEGIPEIGVYVWRPSDLPLILEVLA